MAPLLHLFAALLPLQASRGDGDLCSRAEPLSASPSARGELLQEFSGHGFWERPSGATLP